MTQLLHGTRTCHAEVPRRRNTQHAFPATKLAIVEDNRLIRESLEDFIHTAAECRCVCHCATAEEALKVIPRHQPDIVLMDIQLPNVSGIECTARLKQIVPLARIIIVTVNEDTDLIFKALRAGACGYLLKCC